MGKLSDHARKPCNGLASRSRERQNGMMIEAPNFLGFDEFPANSTLFDIVYTRPKPRAEKLR